VTIEERDMRMRPAKKKPVDANEEQEIDDIANDRAPACPCDDSARVSNDGRGYSGV
jgi:hypothetical protein